MAQTRMTQDAQGDRPSLNALSHTIEGLESRLSEMMQARAASPQRPAPRQFREPQPERTPRERVMPNPVSARIDTELHEMSCTLKELRASVREDFSQSLRDELAGLHTMLSHLDQQTDTHDIDEQTRSELIRISEAVDWLVTNAAADDDSRLMAEFDHLQSLLHGLADAKSITRLENRFENIERHLAPFDPARLDAELKALARGLDDIRRQVDDTDSTRSLEDIESRLSGLAEAMEVLCTRFPAVGKKIDGQIGAIERRIDDINRNLESLGQRQNEPVRDAAIERLEGRLSELSSIVAAVDWQMRDQGAKQAKLLDNLDGMARRLENHSTAEGHLKLEARIEKLANSVERLGPGIDRQTLGKAVSEITDKIGGIDMGGAERRITAKIETATNGFTDEDRRDLKEQLNRLAGLVESNGRNIDPRAIEDAIERVNDRIGRIDLDSAERRIAAKIDTAANGFSDADRQELKQQFSRLADVVESNSRNLEPRALENAVEQINEKIGRIDLQGSERRLAAKLDILSLAAADENERNAVRAELERLADLIDKGPGGIAPAALEAAVSRISDGISRIDIAGAERRLSSQIASMPALNTAPDPHKKPMRSIPRHLSSALPHASMHSTFRAQKSAFRTRSPHSSRADLSSASAPS
nr:hypothetical protein [Marinicella sp. W31]MDC2879098.1 hypothetical protein [Marinicella sp. W31]